MPGDKTCPKCAPCTPFPVTGDFSAPCRPPLPPVSSLKREMTPEKYADLFRILDMSDLINSPSAEIPSASRSAARPWRTRSSSSPGRHAPLA